MTEIHSSPCVCACLSGRAVFAKKTFEKGDFLLKYTGELIDAEEGDRRDDIKETGFRFFFNWKRQKMW